MRLWERTDTTDSQNPPSQGGSYPPPIDHDELRRHYRRNSSTQEKLKKLAQSIIRDEECRMMQEPDYVLAPVLGP